MTAPPHRAAIQAAVDKLNRRRTHTVIGKVGEGGKKKKTKKSKKDVKDEL
jgi:hypothetical protein